jgi:hypothetical protein
MPRHGLRWAGVEIVAVGQGDLVIDGPKPRCLAVAEHAWRGLQVLSPGLQWLPKGGVRPAADGCD